MQFKVKLMNKALENVKTPNFGSDFGLFTRNLNPPKFFLAFYFDELLNIVRSYYHIQFKAKLMNEAWENGKKKLILGPILPLLSKICPLKIFSINLALVVVKCCPKLLSYAIQNKTNEESFRKCQKT